MTRWPIGGTGWRSGDEERDSVASFTLRHLAMNFPMIADPDRKVSNLYGMVHPDADPSITVRTVFVIDPQKRVRLFLVDHPAPGALFMRSSG